RLRLEAGIEQGRLPGDLIPDQVAVHVEARSGGGDLAQLAPATEVALLRQPTVGDPFELCRLQSELSGQALEIRALRDCARFLERREFIDAQSSGSGGVRGRYIRRGASLANDVSQVIFQIHARKANGRQSAAQSCNCARC